VHQRRHATGIHERQACQIDDNRPLTGRHRRKRSSDTYRIYYIKHPAQHDDNLTIAFTGTYIYEGHGHAFLLRQQRRGPDPAAKCTNFYEDYAQYSSLSPAGARPGNARAGPARAYRSRPYGRYASGVADPTGGPGVLRA